MQLLYCFYLNSYRTDAYIRSLAEHADELTILDFSPLRAVFRGQRTSTQAHTNKQLKKYQSPNCVIRYHASPSITPFRGKRGQPINLLLTALAALVYGLVHALRFSIKKCDHCIFYNGHWLFLPLFLAMSMRKVTRTTDLGDLLYLVDNPNPLTKQIELYFIRNSQTVVSVSKPFKEWLTEHYHIPASRISILSAAISGDFPEKFSSVKNQLYRKQLRHHIGAHETDRVLVYSGGIWKKKLPQRGIHDVQGVASLCQAFEALNEQDQPTWLVLLGFSKDSPEFNRYRHGPWRHRFVELGAYQAGDATHCRALGGADILCLPSYPCDTYRLYDRFKTIEYLAAGKAVLAADTAINHHLLGDTGLYFKEGSVDSMVSKLNSTDRTPNFIHASNQRVQQNYNWCTRLQQNLIGRILFNRETLEHY